MGDFNPRSPHGERRCGTFSTSPGFKISIHAPRTGSDVVLAPSGSVTVAFQSTLPARGATLGARGHGSRPHDFNPRSPHGERHKGNHYVLTGSAFQSTLPARGATEMFPRCPYCDDISIHAPRTGSDTCDSEFPPREEISIHAPRTGSDCDAGAKNPARCRFQSTLPARGATQHLTYDFDAGTFQSTLPARGATHPAAART